MSNEKSCSVWITAVGGLQSHQLNASRCWCCSILWSYISVPTDNQTRGMDPLALIAPSLQSSLISSSGCWHGECFTVVMYNFNVGTRGASKKNFIKCSLKLKFLQEASLPYTGHFTPQRCWCHLVFDQLLVKLANLLHCAIWSVGSHIGQYSTEDRGNGND